jgi:uncharacterized protein YukE
MADEIKLDYPLMDEMKKTFAEGRGTLDEVMQALGGIADRMEEGALLGDAGEAFSNAVRGTLVDQVQKIWDKFEQLEGDIDFAVAQMRAAEEKAQKSFS